MMGCDHPKQRVILHGPTYIEEHVMTRKNQAQAKKGPRKTPAKRPAKKTAAVVPVQTKTPAKEPAKTPEPAQEQLATMVEPLAPQAFQLVVNIIDSAPMKGSDAQIIIQLKMELARVAGVQRGQQ